LSNDISCSVVVALSSEIELCACESDELVFSFVLTTLLA